MNAQAPKITPPFAWAGRHLTRIGLFVLCVIAAFMRFFQLTSLPPGLSTTAALIGIQAKALVYHHTFPALAASNYFSPLWIVVQSAAVALFGHTQLALLVMSAVMGLLAVMTTWLWARSWFGVTIAWLAAFLMAITPWAVSLSRTATAYSIYPLLITLTLWLAARYWRTQTTKRAIAVGLALVLNALAGPIGWLVVLLVSGTASFLYFRNRLKLDRQVSVLYLVICAALSLALILYTVLLARHELSHAVHDLGLVGNVTQLGGTIIATILMFNALGDPNYAQNLGGSPELNSFVGLMFIAGLLVSISRLHQRRYRMLLLCLLFLLLPTFIAAVGAPNSFTAAAALPLILAVAALGIAYMLELWYKTFPINSAARTTGQAAISILLLLSLLEGYTQYFHAWAASDGVFAAFNSGPSQMAQDMLASAKLSHKSQTTYVVADIDQRAVIDYLIGGQVPYDNISAAQIANLPSSGAKQFWITADQRTVSVNYLKQKFAGALLQPQYSNFSQSEIYYTYQVTK